MSEQSKIGRRTFFAGLGLAAVAGVAAKISSKSAVPELPEPVALDPKDKGYRLTEHVKKYYRTTTI
ncbi:MAG TPA: hypothetical protein VJ654_05860 [Noviherbaspirillum sp.]|nr:hypothetical protein [Noviherbaspirillum sp.]